MSSLQSQHPVVRRVTAHNSKKTKMAQWGQACNAEVKRCVCCSRSLPHLCCWFLPAALFPALAPARCSAMSGGTRSSDSNGAGGSTVLAPASPSSLYRPASAQADATAPAKRVYATPFYLNPQSAALTTARIVLPPGSVRVADDGTPRLRLPEGADDMAERLSQSRHAVRIGLATPASFEQPALRQSTPIQRDTGIDQHIINAAATLEHGVVHRALPLQPPQPYIFLKTSGSCTRRGRGSQLHHTLLACRQLGRGRSGSCNRPRSHRE